MGVDYYKALGVSKNSKKSEIKKAYRSLAKKYHPDTNEGDAGAESEFNKISEAYEILSDENKRAHYDRFGSNDHRQQRRTDPFAQHSEDIFSHFRQRSPTVEPVFAQVVISFMEAFKGVKKTIVVRAQGSCKTCAGKGYGKGGSREECQSCQGSGICTVRHGNMIVRQPCHDCGGSGRTISNHCESCRGTASAIEIKNLDIEIPRGIQNNSRMEISGEGHYIPFEDIRGNVNVIIRISNHSFFKLHSEDISCSVPITVKTAIFGGSVMVPNPHGNIDIKIPKGTQSGTIFKIKSKGMSLNHMNQDKYGDFLVKIQVEIPQGSPDLKFEDEGLAYSLVNKYEEVRKSIDEDVKG